MSARHCLTAGWLLALLWGSAGPASARLIPDGNYFISPQSKQWLKARTTNEWWSLLGGYPEAAGGGISSATASNIAAWVSATNRVSYATNAGAADTATTATTASMANAGDSATGFFSGGTIETNYLPLLSALAGAVTDAQVPDTITVSAATYVTTAPLTNSVTNYAPASIRSNHIESATWTLMTNTGSAGSDPWTYVVASTNYTNSSTSAANVPQLFFAAAANVRYMVEGKILSSSPTNTSAPRLGWTWPANLTSGAGRLAMPSSTSAEVIGTGDSVTGEVVSSNTAIPTAHRPVLATLDVLMIGGASTSGNFQIRLRSEIAGAQVYVIAGSFIRYRTIP